MSGKASKRAKPLSVLTDEIGLAVIAQTAYGESICMAGSFCPLSSLFFVCLGGGGIIRASERVRESLELGTLLHKDENVGNCPLL